MWFLISAQSVSPQFMAHAGKSSHACSCVVRFGRPPSSCERLYLTTLDRAGMAISTVQDISVYKDYFVCSPDLLDLRP